MSRAVRRLPSAVGLFLAVAFLAAQTPEEVHGWLKDVDARRSAFGEAKLRARATQIENGKVLGTAEFDIYIKGRDRALIVFRGGKNDGRKALTVGQKMWLIVPGAEHPVPITQNQRLMGGASFADVASLRFGEDFEPTLRPGTETVGGQVCRVIDLVAKAPGTAYPRATLWLDADGERLPRKIVFSFSTGLAAREVTFTKFRNVRGRTPVFSVPDGESTTLLKNLFSRSRIASVTRSRADE